MITELAVGMLCIIPGIRGGYTIVEIDAINDLVHLQSNRTAESIYRRIGNIIVVNRATA